METIIKYDKSTMPVLSIISEMPIDIVGYYDYRRRTAQGSIVLWKILILTKKSVIIILIPILS
ncbi:MAG: hypothetical protein RMJ36_01125 [Candidatus Calescibacterium sp.]|nr:hypothetical protein [Candidatus Calescibacterium sp.]MDW8132242.1 hypothetical protein [Candidatus Calescibacterium sp.]